MTVLALCGLVILALVRQQTGTEGFLVGLGLAVLPVPLLMAAFRWLDRVEPGPW
ncbi:PrsW family intramembrane metalloprotease, partial [Streptomyces sp. wa22]